MVGSGIGYSQLGRILLSRLRALAQTQSTSSSSSSSSELSLSSLSSSSSATTPSPTTATSLNNTSSEEKFSTLAAECVDVLNHHESVSHKSGSEIGQSVVVCFFLKITYCLDLFRSNHCATFARRVIVAQQRAAVRSDAYCIFVRNSFEF